MEISKRIKLDKINGYTISSVYIDMLKDYGFKPYELMVFDCQGNSVEEYRESTEKIILKRHEEMVKKYS